MSIGAMEHPGFLKKAKALLILSAWGISILFIIGIPGEVKTVHSVNNATPVKLKIDKMFLTSESCSVINLCDHLHIEATNMTTKLPVKNRIEVEPGVFPFGLSIHRKQVWSTERQYLEEYKPGEVYDGYLASNGRYYLSRGSYFPFAYLLSFAVIWLGGNAIVMLKGSLGTSSASSGSE